MKNQLLAISFVLTSISCFSQSPLSIEKDFWAGTAIITSSFFGALGADWVYLRPTSAMCFFSSV
jgi:hypothetical protein